MFKERRGCKTKNLRLIVVICVKIRIEHRLENRNHLAVIPDAADDGFENGQETLERDELLAKKPQLNKDAFTHQQNFAVIEAGN